MNVSDSRKKLLFNNMNILISLCQLCLDRVAFIIRTAWLGPLCQVHKWFTWAQVKTSAHVHGYLIPYQYKQVSFHKLEDGSRALTQKLIKCLCLLSISLFITGSEVEKKKVNRHMQVVIKGLHASRKMLEFISSI